MGVAFLVLPRIRQKNRDQAGDQLDQGRRGPLSKVADSLDDPETTAGPADW